MKHFAENIKFKTKHNKMPKLVSTGEEVSNNPAWYKKIEAQFKLATSVSQYHTKGMPHDLSGNHLHGVDMVYSPMDASIYNPEGVTVVEIEAQGGELCDTQSPLNKAMLNFFNAIRGKYMNDVPFQAQDLGCYLLSIGSILTILAHIRKMLEIINVYESDSALTPLVLFSALKLNYKTEQKAYADNIMDYDLCIRRLSSLSIPQKVTYFEKAAWQSRYVYREDNGPMSRSDLYTMVPTSVLVWSNNVKTLMNAPELTATGLLRVGTPYGKSISDWITFANKLIDTLVNDDSVRKISGWLHQYLPETMEFAYDVVERNVQIPAYSEEFRYQLLNSKTMKPGAYFDNTTYDLPGIGTGYKAAVRQNIEVQILRTNEVFSNATNAEDSKATITGDLIVNHHAPLTNDQVMEYTRYAPLAKFDDGYRRYIYSGDTYSISKFVKYFNVLSNGVATDAIEKHEFTQYINFDTNLDNYRSIVLKCSSPLLPTIYAFRYTVPQGSPDAKFTGDYAYLYDSKFSFTLPAKNLQKLHTVAVLSEFEADYLSSIRA